MSLASMFARVLDLQHFYSDRNTPEMAERGILIRNDIPNALKEFQSSLASAASLDVGDLRIAGRDNQGRMSQIPWVRFASKIHSPKATEGWYLVLLFRLDGGGAYLALECGATDFVGSSYVSKDPKEIASQVEWARKVLKPILDSDPRIEQTIDLASQGDLAKSYERSTVFAYSYSRDNLPTDDQFRADLIALMPQLGRLYSATQLGHVPNSESPEIRDAMAQIEAIARPKKRVGQGFGLTGPERKAIEDRAMSVAKKELEERGYEWKDVSKNSSFDLLATHKADGSVLKVEVKGTTGPLGSILLTKNEVKLHVNEHPANALVVLHSISLAKKPDPIASGGVPHVEIPWVLDESRLIALSYSYAITSL